MKTAIALGMPLAALMLVGCLAVIANDADAGALAVGNGGAIRISPDGATWLAQCPAGAGSGCVAVDLYDVHYADSKAVAVGAGGRIMTSLDGVAWITQCPAGAGTGCVTADLHDVTFASGQWMAVGNAGTILTSANGSSWTAEASGTTAANLRAVAFGSVGGGQWVVSGVIPDPCVPLCSTPHLFLAFSSNGDAWTENDATDSQYWLNGLAFGGDYLVGAGTNGGNAFRCDADAALAAATPVSCEGNNWSNPCRDVEYGSGQFIMLCGAYVYRATPAAAPAWAQYSSPTGFAVEQVGTLWVMVGAAGVAGTSPDGMAWTAGSTGSGVDMNGLTALPNVRPINLFNGATFPGGLTGNAAQATVQDTNRVFQASSSNRIQISDPDGLPTGFYRVTLSTTLGSLSLSGSTGLSFSCAVDMPVAGLPACAGSASGSSMTFDGTFTNINTALDGLTFTPPSGVCGPPAAVITITTHDEGNFGSGGDLFDTDTVTMTITCPPVNQPPTASCSASLPSPVAVGQAVTFSATGSTDPDGTIAGWEWTFPSGSPTASVTSSQSVTWSAVGSYDVTLRVKDNQNAWSPLVTCTTSVAIFPVAVCNITSPIPRYAGMSLDFASTGSYDPDGAIAEYLWTFPGATPPTASTLSASATWPVPGLVTVTLRVRDVHNAWSPPDSCVVAILDPGPNDPPLALFSYLPVVPTVGEAVSFIDQSSDPDNWDVVTGWQWTFGDGSISSTKNPLRTYGDVGSLPVCLQVTDLSMTPSAPYCRMITVLPAAAPAPDPVPGAPPAEMPGPTGTTTTTSTDPPGTSVPPPAPTLPDRAEARVVGPASVLAGASGTLDGSLSSGSASLAYAWIQLDGERVTMRGADTAAMTFTAPASEQALRFALIVTSGAAASTATLMVRVEGTGAAPPPFTITTDGLQVTVTPGVAAAPYTWNFGDSDAWETSDGAWSHTYDEGGVKSIRLKAAGFETEAVQHIEVFEEAARPTESPAPPSSGPIWPYVALAFAVAAILLLGVLLGRPGSARGSEASEQ